MSSSSTSSSSSSSSGPAHRFPELPAHVPSAAACAGKAAVRPAEQQHPTDEQQQQTEQHPAEQLPASAPARSAPHSQPGEQQRPEDPGEQQRQTSSCFQIVEQVDKPHPSHRTPPAPRPSPSPPAPGPGAPAETQPEMVVQSTDLLGPADDEDDHQSGVQRTLVSSWMQFVFCFWACFVILIITLILRG